MTYNPKIMEHAQNPNNIGALDAKSEHVGTGFVGNAACGDMLKIQILVENGIIKDVKSKIFGCGCAIASTSLATEKLKGMTLDTAKNLTDKEIAEELGLPAIKLHCSVLAARGVLRAIKNYHEKQEMQNGLIDVSQSKNVEMHDISSLDEHGELKIANTTVIIEESSAMCCSDAAEKQNTCCSAKPKSCCSEMAQCEQSDETSAMCCSASEQSNTSNATNRNMCCNSSMNTIQTKVCCREAAKSDINACCRIDRDDQNVSLEHGNTHYTNETNQEQTGMMQAQSTNMCCRSAMIDTTFSANQNNSCCVNDMSNAKISDTAEQKTSCCNDNNDQNTKSCCKAQTSENIEPSANKSAAISLALGSASAMSLSEPFTMTDSAYTRFTQILQMYPEAVGIRIFSKEGGCAGNEYDIELQTAQMLEKQTQSAADTDFKYVYDHAKANKNESSNASQSYQQIVFYIPRASMMFLLGLEIDYITTNVMAQFVFKNKNFRSCGCGSSFRIV